MAPRAKATPDEDLREFNEFVFQDEVYRVKRKFKVARFLKALDTSPVAAIEFALEEDSYEKFLDLEIDMEDLKEFLEQLANTMSGTNSGN
jgi:hypothetical protein